jgi:hypothetical protein
VIGKIGSQLSGISQHSGASFGSVTASIRFGSSRLLESSKSSSCSVKLDKPKLVIASMEWSHFVGSPGFRVPPIFGIGKHVTS